QTALHELLMGMTRLMAPELSFTAEEIWSSISEGSADEKSVHMSSFPVPMDVNVDDGFVRKWEMLTELKSEVSKALGFCRREKVIGHSLDAQVRLILPENVRSVLGNEYSDLKFIFIVSSAEVVETMEGVDKVHSSENLEGVEIGVRRMGGDKCERCWNYFVEDGSDRGEHTSVCSRCIENLESAKA
ncbi:MAG TPA: class I tRNA ligase family protein, partial [Nitrospinaceae bacterium]|nr:class I tRNA ligase family protein [Nitrospinaceae bacterium]